MKFTGCLDEDRTRINRCKDLLCIILPRHLVASCEVGIAGGFCTDLYRLRQGIIVPSNTGFNDIDVFLSGAGGVNEESFSLYTRSFINRGIRAGYKVLGEDIHTNNYVYEDIEVLVRTVFFEGFEDSPVSFVQSPKTYNIRQVVKRFDIDICQVIYDPFKDTLEVWNETVVDHIKQGICQCYPLMIGNVNGVLKSFSIVKVNSTLQRVRKYNERGFLCKELPTLIAEMDVLSETSESESEMQSDSFSSENDEEGLDQTKANTDE